MVRAYIDQHEFSVHLHDIKDGQLLFELFCIGPVDERQAASARIIFEGRDGSTITLPPSPIGWPKVDDGGDLTIMQAMLLTQLEAV